jgi:hypothetical protein
MNKEDAEEFTQSLGQIISGSWRQIALAQRLGVPKALGLTTTQWVHEHLGGYVRMNIAERRAAVQELIANGHSNVVIGEVLGVAESTVRNDLASQNCEASPQNANENNVPKNDASQNCEGTSMTDEERLISAVKVATHEIKSSEAAVERHRMKCGQALLELRTRVEATGQNWWEWEQQHDHFSLGRKTMERYMRLATPTQ